MEPVFLIYPVLFVVGAVSGAAVNWFVDRYCWTPRYRSPWRIWPSDFLDKLNAAGSESRRRKNRSKKTPREADAAPFEKRWFDFFPIFGVLSMSRIGSRLESLSPEDRLPGLENRLFWGRLFFVELLSALGLCGLFYWEVSLQMLRPDGVVPEPWETVVLRFIVHGILFVFLLAASLIDIDDMIIPDNLTVVGTLLALTLAFMAPQTLLPSMTMGTELVLPAFTADRNPASRIDFRYTVAPEAVPLNLCSPNSADALFGNGFSDPQTRGSLGIMLGLWLFWGFAMLPRVWYFKLPFRKAAAIFCRYLRRSPWTKTVLWILAAAPLMVVVIPLFFFSMGDRNLWPEVRPQFVGLYSALVGMATGMAIIWATRIIGSVVLGREAMGFGDVTLMGLIGAFVGWQVCLLVFFLAPIAGMLLWIFNAAVGRGREFPYGPYLCLATAIVVLGWGSVWTEVGPIYYELGGLVAVIMVVCLVMLGVLLGLWRWIRSRLFGF